MSRLPVVLLLLMGAPAAALPAQSRPATLLDAAREAIAANRMEDAAALLDTALASAPYVMDSVQVLMLRAAVEHLRGHDDLARERIRAVFALKSGVTIRDLEAVSARFKEIFDEEARAGHMPIHIGSALQQPPVRRSGPSVRYPRHLRHVAGVARVQAVIDTIGRVEPTSVAVIELPDSGFLEPLKEMMRGQVFSPGRHENRVVRSLVLLRFNLSPPPRGSPTALIRGARDRLARNPDSALALVSEALDSEAGASDGERMFGLLVQGLAHRRLGHDSLASAAFDSGLAIHRELSARGVDLAPFLKRLGDSIRVSRRRPAAASRPAALGTPTAVEAVDQGPALISHPPIRYAPEMQALRIGGTVLVEAMLDTTGRAIPTTIRVVQSPNPAFNAEARRLVVAATYSPVRKGGRPVRVVIRQPITFAPY